MVSVLHKELEYNVEKLTYKRVGFHTAEDQNQMPTSCWWINHPGSVHTTFYSPDWLISLLFISEEWLWERSLEA